MTTRIQDWRTAFAALPSLLQFLSRLEDKLTQRAHS
jgi:hypothetical protein